jgi:hypothetical protein
MMHVLRRPQQLVGDVWQRLGSIRFLGPPLVAVAMASSAVLLPSMFAAAVDEQTPAAEPVEEAGRSCRKLPLRQSTRMSALPLEELSPAAAAYARTAPDMGVAVVVPSLGSMFVAGSTRQYSLPRATRDALDRLQRNEVSGPDD